MEQVADFCNYEGMCNVYGHTSISYLKCCNGYTQAKQGSIEAARQVVTKCAKQSVFDTLKDEFPTAVMLPVITRNNCLPLALAEHSGMSVCNDARLENPMERKNMSAMQRLVFKPQFSGRLRGGQYILVDDVVTQGGVIHSLCDFVYQNGGTVAAVMAFAFSIGSRDLLPDMDRVEQLEKKFGNALIQILHSYEIAPEPTALTNSQVKYLLKFSSCQRILDKINSCFIDYNI